MIGWHACVTPAKIIKKQDSGYLAAGRLFCNKKSGPQQRFIKVKNKKRRFHPEGMETPFVHCRQ